MEIEKDFDNETMERVCPEVIERYFFLFWGQEIEYLESMPVEVLSEVQK
jgi:hypothetical protein